MLGEVAVKREKIRGGEVGVHSGAKYTWSGVGESKGGSRGRWNSCKPICYPHETGSQKVSDHMYDLQSGCYFIFILQIPGGKKVSGEFNSA